MDTQTEHPDAPPRDAFRDAKRWLGVAIGALMLAGLFSLVLVVGRAPYVNDLVTDPQFAKRCLVVHVNLALVVWFYAFLAALFHLIPAKRSVWRPAALAAPVAVVGALLFTSGMFLPSARAILSNYVPMLDHPVFLAGIITFFGALALTFCDGRLLAGNEDPEGDSPIPPAARPGLRAGAMAYLLAMLTFAAAWRTTPPDLTPDAFYEFAFWGGGHVLQFANVAGMVSVWLILLTGLTGRSPISRGRSAVLFGLLVLPLLYAPLLAGQGATEPGYMIGFTRYMQFGIFPVVGLFLVGIVVSLVRAKRAGELPRGFWRDARFAGFAVSAFMTLLGFGLGAMISRSNTVIPAHYHVSIGAVTASYMAVAYVLLKRFGWKIPTPRLERLSAWQPLLFGVGQSIFAGGLALAGTWGAQRKVYGSEQHVRSTVEWVGLGIMGVGGVIAIVGGISFLWILGAMWKHRRRPQDPATTPVVEAVRAEADDDDKTPALVGQGAEEFHL